jgi:alkylation response protein AidB-like acyl-CoA dehydrogenase
MKIERHLAAYRERVVSDDSELVHLGRHATEIAAARLLAYRILATQMAGGEPGAIGSVAKLFWSEAWQRLAERDVLSAGEGRLAERSPGQDPIDPGHLYLDSRWATVSSGTSEIQREIVARRVLGLPRSDRN